MSGTKQAFGDWLYMQYGVHLTALNKVEIFNFLGKYVEHREKALTDKVSELEKENANFKASLRECQKDVAYQAALLTEAETINIGETQQP